MQSFQATKSSPAEYSPEDLLRKEQIRAVLLLKLLEVVNPRSGFRRVVADFLIALLNEKIYPTVGAWCS